MIRLKWKDAEKRVHIGTSLGVVVLDGKVNVVVADDEGPILAIPDVIVSNASASPVQHHKTTPSGVTLDDRSR